MDGASISHPRLLHDRQGGHARAIFNLVMPLAQKATAMRITDTAGSSRFRSGAVFLPIGAGLRRDDMDSMNDRSTPRIQTTPGCRISTTVIRTTTIRTTTTGRARSADQYNAGDADFYFEELAKAYFDCRRTKRNTHSALDFEQNLERNLTRLHGELRDGSYRPGRSICFVITRPKPREVWAADFRDRVVHHLLYNRISPRFYASFITDSCACIPGRGTLYAARRLEAKIRSLTQNWSRPAYYLKCDIANFFVAIDKRILRELIAARVSESWWLQLAETILFHDPRADVEVRGKIERMSLVPPHKSLFNQPAHLGLPIGNLSSQFFANIYLDVLDQYIKHSVRAKHYIRYVDDFVLLHDSPQWLNQTKNQIEAFLPQHLGLRLKPAKTILQPIERGVDFVGHVIKPWRRTIRRRTLREALSRTAAIEAGELFETSNSYFGLLRQASHSHADRAQLANLLLQRGHAVNGRLTKAFRSNADRQASR